MKETKTRPLQKMFDRVPRRYDLINRIITWGLDRPWRKKAVRRCLEHHPQIILDLGCGTGDLAIELAETGDRRPLVIGFDFSRPMLETAVKKASRMQNKINLTWIQGDVRELPFADSSLACAGISFAFRNLTYRNPYREVFLREICRVLKSGGRFVIVESSRPQCKLIHVLFRWYVRVFVSAAGRLVSKDRGAYRYLAESVIHFYTPDEVAGLLRQAGFSRVEHQPLLFGAAALHTAVK